MCVNVCTFVFLPLCENVCVYMCLYIYVCQ